MSTILFCGDSITFGDYSSVQGTRWSSLFAGWQPGATETNLGVPGTTVSTWASGHTSLSPADICCVELGTNDYTSNTTAASFLASYEALLAQVQSQVRPRLIIALGLWRQTGVTNSVGLLSTDYENTIKTLVIQIPGTQFVPLTPLYPILAYKTAGLSSWQGTSDGFHPVDTGHFAIAQQVQLAFITAQAATAATSSVAA